MLWGAWTRQIAVVKLATERWKETSDAEKRPFQKEYEEKMAQYKKARNEQIVEERQRQRRANELDAEAKKLGFLFKLTTLSENVKVKSSSVEILAELQKQSGSVVAEKKALVAVKNALLPKKLRQRKLKTLSENVKVKSSSVEILAELQKQNGSVVAAKKALLGARKVAEAEAKKLGFRFLLKLNTLSENVKVKSSSVEILVELQKQNGVAAKKALLGAPSEKAMVPLNAVERKAKKLGFFLRLQTLVLNVKVKSSRVKILAELQKQNGSVVAAKKALLGARGVAEAATKNARFEAGQQHWHRS